MQSAQQKLHRGAGSALDTDYYPRNLRAKISTLAWAALSPPPHSAARAGRLSTGYMPSQSLHCHLPINNHSVYEAHAVEFRVGPNDMAVFPIPAFWQWLTAVGLWRFELSGFQPNQA